MADNDNRTVVVFKIHTRRNEAKSRAAGRPIFDDIEVCEMRFPANRQTIAVFPAHSFHRWVDGPDGLPMRQTYAQRWAEQYRRFKEQRTQIQEGTPLAELPFLAEAKRAELRALNIHTAEALAALDGQELKNLGMGGRDLKNQAQAYLDNARDSAGATKFAAENAELRAQLQQQAEEMRALAAQVAAMRQAPQPAARDASPAPAAFADYTDEDLKVWIANRTGARPRGNPAHDTLVRMAEEIDAAPQEAA